MKVEGGGRREEVNSNCFSPIILYMCCASRKCKRKFRFIFIFIFPIHGRTFAKLCYFCKVNVTFDLIVVVYQFLIIHSFLSNDYNFVLDTFVKKYNKIVIEIVVKKLCTYECTISKRILKYNGFARST